MSEWIREQFGRRPWWMNALMLFCAYMTFIYLPWDLFVKPIAHDEEVWFGIRFYGWAAKLTEPLHWAIYAAGLYGFWRMRSWMVPWAGLYMAQVALGMLIWSLVYMGGAKGFFGGVIAALPFAAMASALFNAHGLFGADHVSLRERYGRWALITGASAGIGESFARALAREKVSCVLVARREERLQELAKELEASHGVETRVIAQDLSQRTATKKIIEAVKDLPISLLVNNAGFGYAGRFDALSAKRLEEMVQVKLYRAHASHPPLFASDEGAKTWSTHFYRFGSRLGAFASAQCLCCNEIF